MLRRLWSDQSGMSTMEYAILLMLVALSALFSWQGLSETTRSPTNDASGGIANVGE